MLQLHAEPYNEEISHPLLEEKKVRLFIKREDIIHPHVSGNKWRKLKYNLVEAKSLGHDTLLTFGGAYSNHIYATAAAAKEAGFKSIGIIRGDELKSKPRNKTLLFAEKNGMQLEFVDRMRYREKNSDGMVRQLNQKYNSPYIIPEGGTNMLAIKGCEEIITSEDRHFDFVCCSVGTGGTMSGVICGMQGHGKLLGFSALKGNFLTDEITSLLNQYDPSFPENWEVIVDYHHGGYAKTSESLVEFISDFEKKIKILLDPIYTGKMLYGIFDMVRKGCFLAGTKILVIHTGGLQGRF